MIVSSLEYRNKTPFFRPYIRPHPPAAVIDIFVCSISADPDQKTSRSFITRSAIKSENLAGKQVLLLYATPTRATTNDIHRTPNPQRARSILIQDQSLQAYHTPYRYIFACKQIRLEARPIFFQQNLIVSSRSLTLDTPLRGTSDITRLLCRLHCVIKNDTASCGMLKVLARCTNLYSLKISVKTKDMDELMYHGAWDCFHGFAMLTSNFGSELLGRDRWDDFKKLVMSACNLKSCHMHSRSPKHDGRQPRCLEIDLKVTT